MDSAFYDFANTNFVRAKKILQRKNRGLILPDSKKEK